jgi:hypothetical protein
MKSRTGDLTGKGSAYKVTDFRLKAQVAPSAEWGRTTPHASENDHTALVSRVPRCDSQVSDHDQREAPEPTGNVAGHDEMPTAGHVDRENRNNDSNNTQGGGDAG